MSYVTTDRRDVYKRGKSNKFYCLTGKPKTFYYIKCFKCGNRTSVFEADGIGINNLSKKLHDKAIEDAIACWNKSNSGTVEGEE